MGSLPAAKLSLDLKRSFLPKSIANILYNLSTFQSSSDQLSSLHDYLSRFQDELQKIDAFKQELPLCVLLLNDAISVLKEELEKCRTKNCVPVLEEFIFLKKVIESNEENNNINNNDDVDDERDDNNECIDKKNWMSSVQLWNNNTTTNNNNASDHKLNYHNKFETKKREEEGQSMTVTVAEDPFQSCSSNRNGGSAFTPFSTYSSVPVTTVTLAAPKEEKEETVMNRLSLLIPGVKNLREGFGSRGSRSSTNRGVSLSPPTSVQTSLRSLPHQPQQTARKQRRCWSPELHRRFVNALQKLGGSQAATPKQIRELMQVDGLTNDEVKSHLQKYRLHTRRVPAVSGNQSALGGLWMSQEHYNNSSKGSSSATGSPDSPLHLATESRGGTSPTEGDSMEDDEDAKSESYSWKNHTHRPGKVGV